MTPGVVTGQSNNCSLSSEGEWVTPGGQPRSFSIFRSSFEGIAYKMN